MLHQPDTEQPVSFYLNMVRSAVRHWPFSRGKGWLVNRLTARLRSWPEEILLQFDNGTAIHADLRDPMFRSLFFFGEYEEQVSRVIETILRPGDVVIDAGANFGHFSLIASRRVGEDGHVFAFEPMPAMAERLVHNLRSNRLDNVTVEIAALGKETGTAVIHVPPSGIPSGHASLSEVGFIANQKVNCPVVTIDGYLRDKGAPVVNFMKIDVEGSELMLLNGARSLLGSSRPPLMTIECNYETAKAFGYEPFDLLEFLRNHANYEFLDIRRDGVRPLPDGAKPVNGANLLCYVPEDHSERIRSLGV